MGKLRSWSCKGCTNVCYRLINGEVAEYCRPTLEHRHRKEWITEEYIACLDYTTDPEATDNVIRMWEENNERLQNLRLCTHTRRYVR